LQTYIGFEIAFSFLFFILIIACASSHPRMSSSTDRSRTADVIDNDNGESQIDFSQMLLSPAVLAGLNFAGFTRPSPIQRKAIPIGRLGVGMM
jgi:hypothetical protein